MCFNMAASRTPTDCGQTATALVRFIHKLPVDSVRPTWGYHWSESRGDPWKSLDVSFEVISALSIWQLAQASVAAIAATLRTGWVVRDSNLGTGKDYSLFQKKPR